MEPPTEPDSLVDPSDATAARRLTPERAFDLRRRIADGVYDLPRVLEEIARRIVRARDL